MLLILDCPNLLCHLFYLLCCLFHKHAWRCYDLMYGNLPFRCIWSPLEEEKIILCFHCCLSCIVYLLGPVKVLKCICWGLTMYNYSFDKSKWFTSCGQWFSSHFLIFEVLTDIILHSSHLFHWNTQYGDCKIYIEIYLQVTNDFWGVTCCTIIHI